jgi:hypothetical protein
LAKELRVPHVESRWIALGCIFGLLAGLAALMVFWLKGVAHIGTVRTLEKPRSYP